MPFGNQPIRGGKSATISVAASDTAYKAGADFLADGSCDEVEINAAIAALPSLGGSVYLCEGTYNVCGPIVIDKDNVTIIGAGASTVIRIRDNHNAAINVIEATNHDNLLVKDLRIDGNRANQAAGAWNMWGIYFNAVDNSIIASCQIDNMFRFGIYLEGSSHNRVSGNTFYNNYRAIYLYHSSNGNTVDGNVARNSDMYGIYLHRLCSYNAIGDNVLEDCNYGIYLITEDCDYNTVVGNTCNDNHHGIFLSTDSDYNTVTGNTCEGNDWHGIFVGAADYNVVADNVCVSNGRHGIFVSSSDHNTIEGNSVINNGLDADVTYDGINVDANSDYNHIQGNTVRTTVAAPPPNRQRYGINIAAATCDGNLVVCNDLHQAGQTGGYNDAGTNTRGTADGQCLETSVVASTLVVAATDSIDPTRADYQCDGASDETEINAAITALGATGGTVKLLEGTFTVDSPIEPTSNVALVGQGAGTVITIANGHDANMDVIWVRDTKTRVLIKDLRIDGNRANQAAGVMYGIYLCHLVTHSKIVNCWVENMYGGDGIYLSDDNTYNLIEGNTVTGNGRHGIHLYDENKYNTIVDNTVTGNDNHGIHLSFADNHNIVADNEVVNNGLAADVTYDGIIVELGSDRNSIQGNTVRTTVAVPPPNRQRYGINIATATCIENLVKNNDLHQSGQTAYFNDAGTATRLPSIEAPIFDDINADAVLSTKGDHIVIQINDNADVFVAFNFRVPDDFHQLVRARVVVVPGADGDLNWGCETDWGACGEFFNAGSDAIAVHTEAVSSNVIKCLDINAALDDIAAGDHVGVRFHRDSIAAADTIGDVVHLLQFWLQYV